MSSNPVPVRWVVALSLLFLACMTSGCGSQRDIREANPAIAFYPAVVNGGIAEGPIYVVDGQRLDVLEGSHDRVARSYYLQPYFVAEYQKAMLPLLSEQATAPLQMCCALPRARVIHRDGRWTSVYPVYQSETKRFNDDKFDAVYRMLGSVDK